MQKNHDDDEKHVMSVLAKLLIVVQPSGRASTFEARPPTTAPRITVVVAPLALACDLEDVTKLWFDCSVPPSPSLHI